MFCKVVDGEMVYYLGDSDLEILEVQEGVTYVVLEWAYKNLKELILPTSCHKVKLSGQFPKLKKIVLKGSVRRVEYEMDLNNIPVLEELPLEYVGLLTRTFEGHIKREENTGIKSLVGRVCDYSVESFINLRGMEELRLKMDTCKMSLIGCFRLKILDLEFENFVGINLVDCIKLETINLHTDRLSVWTNVLETLPEEAPCYESIKKKVLTLKLFA